MLDVCCYTGGFALAAARLGDCRHITAVDSSLAALDLARRNAELNGLSEQISFHCEDAFTFLEQQLAAGEKYDVIVLDPPKLARTRGGIERALKAYARLNQLAMQLLNPDGTLITCSCSGHVLREDFQQVLARASLDAGRRVQILEERGQAEDHPVLATCLETGYLKCFVCRVI
jgi:23S rRNA (cytosine1962-C5)-methyltransferase